METPRRHRLVEQLVMNGASTSTLPSWKWVCGALLVQKFADDSDELN